MRTYIMNLTFEESVIRTYWEKCTQDMYTQLGGVITLIAAHSSPPGGGGGSVK